MIEKLKPHTEPMTIYVQDDNGDGTFSCHSEQRYVEIVGLSPADLKINEIIDIVNLLLQPHEATTGTIPLSQAPKKRTAREVVEAQRQEFMNGVYPEHASLVSVYDAILEAFDREGIE